MKRISSAIILVGMFSGILFGQSAGPAASQAGGQAATEPVKSVELRPLPAGLDARAGKALVDLARLAMREYLLHRTPADKLQIPAEIKNFKIGQADKKDILLGELAYSVSLTIRTLADQKVITESAPAAGHKETSATPLEIRTIQVSETCTRNLGNLCLNVASAAQEAMRSPKLPDRVTQEVLDGLTIEIEVAGRMTECPADDIARTYRQGLTGLCLSMEGRSAQIMPAECYISDLDCRQAMEKCIRNIQAVQQPNSPLLWGTFNTRHFIETGPKKTVFAFYRGKLLDPPDRLEEKNLLASALRVGLYLRAHQTAEGRYDFGNSDIWQHAYATLAMAKLAGLLEEQKDKFAGTIRESVNAAMKYTINFSSNSIATRPATQPTDNLAVASLLVLAVDRLPTASETENFRKDLLAGIFARFADTKHVSEQLASGKQPPPDLHRSYYLACMAMSAGMSAASEKDMTVLANLRMALGKVVPQNQELYAWSVRAGITPDEKVAARFSALAGLPAGTDGPLDEIGALVAPGQPVDTVASAIQTICLPEKSDKTSTMNYPAVKLTARRFCHAMIYKAEEAWFESKPEDWVGGVREKPSGTAVSLPACAAAIEALLAK